VKNLSGTLKNLLISALKFRYGNISAKPLKDFPQKEIKRIAILVQERIGDTILTTPLLKHLHLAFPEMKIDLIGVRPDNEILRNDSNIQKLYNLSFISGQDKLELFRQQYDILYNTKDHPSFTFLWLSRRIKADIRIGLDHPDHRGSFHFLISLPDETATVEKNCAILDLLGVQNWRKDLKPYFNQGPVSSEIEAFVQGDIPVGGVIGINLSASNIYKSWKTDNYRKLLKKLEQPSVVFALPEKRDEKEHLEREFLQAKPSPLTPTINDVAYLIKQLKCLITPDTSLVHLASCFNIPVVALYRTKRDYSRFPPYSDYQKVLISETELTDDIPHTDVLEGLQELLNKIE
jgi:ADP-heptose:LPS heptosyltransferase